MLSPLFRLSFLTLRCLLAGGLCLAMPLALQCQVSAPRQVSGIVTDQTGAAIVGAEVVFTSGSFSATQAHRRSRWLCIFPDSAEPGALKISAPGFQVRTLDWHGQAPADHSAARNRSRAGYGRGQPYGRAGH